ncbi:phosphoribosylformylglycinamidine synthase [Candidatus Peregrinibacteria bacterium HGW-Peregrinibacteria-1]|jgi:phosphoribosylformylglycinamidine synthase|nr:MAG: phosphoribosylformylglycinamidine synthase [Candidatus Peregrinibacteria bacterium HGW-Peregrinibacteria-1]
MKIINVITTLNDTRSKTLTSKLKTSFQKLESAHIIDSYLINKEFHQDHLDEISKILSNSISQKTTIGTFIPPNDTSFIIVINYLPGVTDNLATIAKEAIRDHLKIDFQADESIHSTKIILLKGILSSEELISLKTQLSNPLIQKFQVFTNQQYSEKQQAIFSPPLVEIKPRKDPADTVSILTMSDAELKELGKKGIKNQDGSFRGPLSLSLQYLNTIKEYFRKTNRNPYDIELESIAQTWSEHCKHTIFASPIDEIAEGLYKGYIKRATNEIRSNKGDQDICVSVFSDNAGGIIFDENWIITDKAETHNSPSALDPFGGAITGIVGVNRDTIGFGKGAKPIINKYGFCVGNLKDNEPIYRDASLHTPTLTPPTILNGIIAGVNEGGNCSGIPTPQGFVYFHNDYKGKPLVFVGTVGLIPRNINSKPSWAKSALPGDLIVVIGGRVGLDGIHGATFSSEELDPGSPSTAVQIGDPYIQKKLSDALIKEARDLDLYNSITDNGAGGISCSVAEMAKESYGCYVELDKVPTKYPNLAPWEIWISESQERMTLAIPPEKYSQFLEIMEKHEVESAIIGKFTDSGKCQVSFNKQIILDLELDFLHDGVPLNHLQTDYTPKTPSPTQILAPENITDELLTLLQSPNIASYKFISRQYDHNVQGGSIIKPLQGPGEVNTDTTVTQPLTPEISQQSKRAIICSQGINPHYSALNTYHMAAAAIDTAIRNIISAGGPLSHLALMDNFCWCSATEPYRLGQLKESAKACYEYAVAYGTPFISGKDSMFNDFNGYDKNGEPIKISAPPTLLISSIGVIKDYTKSISIDPKLPGDLLYILGETLPEMGGSQYLVNKNDDQNEHVPKVNASTATTLYNLFTAAAEKRLIASSISPNLGGLAIALAKKSISSQFGIEIDLTNIPRPTDFQRLDFILFSETHSRFIVSIAPENKEAFEKHFQQVPFAHIGHITSDNNFTISHAGASIIKTTVDELTKNYHKPYLT